MTAGQIPSSDSPSGTTGALSGMAAPTRIGDMFAAWMATADGCNCGNNQTPNACIPSTTPGMAYRCHYICGDCGQTWTRAYPPTRKEAAA